MLVPLLAGAGDGEGNRPARQALGRAGSVGTRASRRAEARSMKSGALERLRTVQRADVYKQDRRVATLARERDGTRFAYLPDAVAGGGPGVATALPVTAEAVMSPAGAVPPFFAGLLPEGRRLTSL